MTDFDIFHCSRLQHIVLSISTEGFSPSVRYLKCLDKQALSRLSIITLILEPLLQDSKHEPPATVHAGQKFWSVLAETFLSKEFTGELQLRIKLDLINQLDRWVKLDLDNFIRSLESKVRVVLIQSRAEVNVKSYAGPQTLFHWYTGF